MKKISFTLLFFIPLILWGQDNPLPANEQNPKRSYKWNALGARIGIGYQYSFYTELGLSFIHHEFDSHEGPGNLIFFAAHHWTPVNGVMGVKVGADLNFIIGVIGVEFNYQFKNDMTDFVFTPKYGFGLGFCNIIYGYNFSSNK